MRLIICSLYILLSNVFYSFGQDSFGKITSQPADFIRYGLTPVSYFSGKANVEIPLYTLQDPDFPMPLSLSYASDGLKPAKHSGLAGLDWVLNFGGVITREIYGAPDDANGYNGYDSASDIEYNTERGFWIASQERKFTAKQLLAFDPSIVRCDSYYCYLPMTSGGYYYDAQPDLFLFRFPNATGHFMIDNDGHIQSTDPELKIDISGLSVQHVENQYPRNSVIKITDGNGYIYSFGGNLSALEYRNNVKPGYNTPVKDKCSVIMAWHLVKIQAPNGRVMNFNYASEFVDRIDSPYWQASSSNDNTPWDKRTYSAIKGVYPTSITIPDTGVSVEFSLSRETCRKFYLGFADYNYLSFQLSSLSVKQDSKEIYKYVFEYDNRKHLRFLKSVHLPGGGIYRMEYNHTTYPEPDTKDVDFWGYWSRATPLNNGLLKKIIYPTGGHSEFLYESHSYRERVETRVYINSFAPMLVEKEGVAGGFRILQICNMDGKTQKKECRTFKYEDQSNRKSGILCQYPPYLIDNRGNQIHLVTDIWYKNYNIEDQHVGYSNVKECFDDGSFIYYVYSDYKSNPDKPDVFLKQNTKASELSLVSCNVNRVTSASQERGRLLSKSFFQKNGSLSKRKSYFYSDIGANDEMLPLDPDLDRIPFDPSNYIVSFRSMEGGALAKKIYLKSYPLQAIIERTFAPQGSVLQSKRYKYNRLNQLVEQKDYCSDGSILKHTYAYPNERTSLNISNIYNRMTAANMINKPVEETVFRNALQLTSSRTTYRMHGSLPVKDSIMQSFRNEPYQFMTTYPYYDSLGHALFEINRDGTRTIRLWGYNCRYLVAEIRNIPETDMNAVWNIIRPESFSFTSSPDFSFISVLRRSYPDIQVYLYTYSPLVGVLSVTSPNGKVTNFHYDAAGRLVEKRDHTGRIESMYEYNYMSH